MLIEIKKEVSEEYIKKVIQFAENHFNKYKHRKMTLKELDNIVNYN